MLGFIDKIKNEIRDDLVKYVLKLDEQRTEKNKCNIDIHTLLEIIEYESLNNDELNNLFQYKKWAELKYPILKYLEKRLNVRENYRQRIVGSLYSVWLSDECIGETYKRVKEVEKYREQAING